MRACGRTDIGLVRKENQDTFAVAQGQFPGQTIAVVCDGMGGVHGGRKASTLAAETFTSELKALLREKMEMPQLRETVSFCTAKANRAVFDAAQQDEALLGMGTTLVAAVSANCGVVVCNVGDSRAYLIRRNTIRRVTRDHSVVQDLLSKGELTEEEARYYPNRNVITRALGPEQSVLCDCYELSLKAGDRLLLCSDGLAGVLTDAEILEQVRSGGADEEILARLIEEVKRRGAPDNVTVVLTGSEGRR